MRRLFSFATSFLSFLAAFNVASLVVFLVSFLATLLLACNNPAYKTDFPESKSTLKGVQGNTANSIYQLDATWTNQDGQQIATKSLAGKTQVVAMIFTSCGYACPAIVQNMQHIESGLSAVARNKTHFTLISFDTKTDTPERLRQYATQKNLGQNWTLLHGDDDAVRVMSMLLSVPYSPSASGGFNHENVITILDQNGVIIKRMEGLDINTADAVHVIESAVAD